MVTTNSSLMAGRTLLDVKRNGLTKDIQDMKRAFDKLARMVAESEDHIRVIFRGTDCFTDGKTIVLPNLELLEKTNMTEKEVEDARRFLEVVRGYLMHEVGHVRWTEFRYFQMAAQENPLLKHLLNLIEDPRVEKKMSKLWRGAGVSIKATLDWTAPKVLEQIDSDEGTLIGKSFLAIGYLLRYGTKHWFWKKLPKEVKHLIAKVLPDEVREARKVDSTKEAYDLSKRIMKKLKQFTEEPPEDKEEEDDEDADDESGDEGEDGDGEFSLGVDPGEEGEAGGDDGEEEEGEDEGGGGEGSDEEEEDDDGDGDGGGGDEGDEDGDDDEAGGGSEEGDEGAGEGGDSGDDSDSGSGDDDGDGEDARGGGAGRDSGEADDGDGSDDDEGGGASEEELKEKLKNELTNQQHTAAAQIDKGTAKQFIANSLVLDRIAPERYLIYSTEHDREEDATEGHLGDYSRMLDDARSHFGVLKRNLGNFLKARTQHLTVTELEEGELDPSVLYRLANKTSDRVFKEELEQLELHNVALVLLINLSGSMSSLGGFSKVLVEKRNPVTGKVEKVPDKRGFTRVQLAQQTALLMSEVLDSLHVKFAIYGHTTGDREAQMQYARAKPQDRETFTRWGATRITVYKRFEENYQHVKTRICDMRAQNNTHDAEGLLFAGSRLLEDKQATRRVIMTIDDGQPIPNLPAMPHADHYKCHRLHQEHVRTVVGALERNGVEVIGMGMATQDVKHFYKQHVVVNNVEEFPKIALQELKRILLIGQRKAAKAV